MELSKTTLRRLAKSARLDMAPDLRQQKSDLISAKLTNLMDWSETTRLHVYEPILELGEVDISLFINRLAKEHPSIRLYTSRRQDRDWRIESYYKDAQVIVPRVFDAVIVPMLCFDESLHRIGYGGGYYDRFLSVQEKARAIGVCFEAGRVAQIPAEAHDVPLDVIITEKDVYTRPQQ